jgi:hypothetical protein
MSEDQRSPQAENRSTQLHKDASREPSRSGNVESMDEDRTHMVNPDSHGLGWYGNDRVVIGCVDEVNGPGSIEFPSFVPTRHELVQLAKYWATVQVDLDFSLISELPVCPSTK